MLSHTQKYAIKYTVHTNRYSQIPKTYTLKHTALAHTRTYTHKYSRMRKYLLKNTAHTHTRQIHRNTHHIHTRAQIQTQILTYKKHIHSNVLRI